MANLACQRLPLFLLILCATLPNLKSRVALANDVDSSTPAYNLAIWMAELKRANRGNNFHDLGLNILKLISFSMFRQLGPSS